MFLATIVAAGILLFGRSTIGVASSGPHAVQSSWAQQNPQSSSQPAASSERKAPSQPEQAPVAAPKPCSASQSGSTSKSDCKTTAPGKPKSKKQPAHKEAKSADAAPSKSVVRNGGTGEPSVTISSDEGQRQAARMQETNRLLAAADLNLKDVAVRGLDANQEATVKQIRSYMDQAKAAASSGDVERAYNLANKANMLAADLNR